MQDTSSSAESAGKKQVECGVMKTFFGMFAIKHACEYHASPSRGYGLVPHAGGQLPEYLPGQSSIVKESC
jgi:hypothetical protein